jgi:hypothetical protein
MLFRASDWTPERVKEWQKEGFFFGFCRVCGRVMFVIKPYKHYTVPRVQTCSNACR